MPDEQIETPTSEPVDAGAVTPETSAETPVTADTPAAATEAPYWADDWRERIAGNNEDELKQLRRYASPEGLWKKARSLEKRLSSGEFKRARPDTADEAVLSEWRKENNVPETADGYVAALPEDLTVAEADFPALTRIFQKMHAAGTPAAEAAEVVKEYYAMQAEAAEQRAVADRQFRVASEDELRGEWGLDYRPNMDAVGMLVEEFGSRDDFQAIGDARLSDGTRLGDSPVILKFLANIARDRYSDALISSTPAGGLMGGGGSLEEQIQLLESEIQDTKGRDPNGYWNNPGKQSKYLALLAERDRQAKRGR